MPKPPAVVLNYPNNPTARTVDLDFYAEVVDFCLYHGIYILSDLAYAERAPELPRLPYGRSPFTRYFPQSRIYCRATERRYVIANLAKGGVVKIFDRHTGKLLLDDSGIIGRLTDGRVVTSQWIDPDYECEADEDGWKVTGSMQVVPSGNPFSPMKHLVFRAVLLSLGWIPRFSHLLKAIIRRKLILGRRPAPVHFERSLRFEDGVIALRDEVRLDGKTRFEELSGGGGFTVRYVPQSRYFQAPELEFSSLEGYAREEVVQLRQGGSLVRVEKVQL